MYRLNVPCVCLLACLLACVGATTALADDATKIVLHTISHQERVHCFIPEELGYRQPATQTVTSVAAGADIDVFLYLLDYDTARGAGFELVWPSDWVYFGWSADCLGHQVTITDFLGDSIHIGTVFDVLAGGQLAPLGYAPYTTGAGGELYLESTTMCHPASICYIDGDAVSHPIDPQMTGRIAVGGEGHNPAAVAPVEGTTWGMIKTRYR